MSSLMTIKLNKTQGMSWGFRLQGGKDFATPLCIQKVNMGSIAEKAGLQAGDAIVSIGGHDAFSLRHKDAQDAIVRGGNTFDLVIQRGMQTWRPAVSALPEVKSTPEGVFATSTSLAATPQKPNRYIGSNYNSLPRPYPGSTSLMNGRSNSHMKSVTPNRTQNSKISPTSSTSSAFSATSQISPRISPVPPPAISPTRKTFSNGFHTPPRRNSENNIAQSNKTNSVSKSNGNNSSLNIWSKFLDIDAATSELKISGTDISLDKEKAKHFLLITLDKEAKNYENTKSPCPTPPNLSRRNSSNASSVGGINSFIKPKGTRKFSFNSNSSSRSSTSSQEGDHEGTIHNPSMSAPDHHPHQLVNAQFNSPSNIYSEDSIAETLSAQAEVLDQGVLGVNFMKNDKNFDGKSSDVLRMVQEMDNEPPRQVESPGIVSGYPTNVLGTCDKPVVQGYSFKLLEMSLHDGSEGQSSAPGSPSIVRSVQAPRNSDGAPRVITSCAECERPIVGVFVRIKDKNLHSECFKCATCGSSLKNVGYYNISNKLYCDIHAKQAARQNPPAPNMVPITVQPGMNPPAGAMTSPQARATAAPFHPKAPAPAPVPAPEPVLPEPIVQEPLVPEADPVPELKLPEPEPEPQPIVEVPEEIIASPAEPETEPVDEVRAPLPAPSLPKPAPIAPAPVVAPTFQTSANPQTFGAPAGGVNVRSHIPKKDAAPAPNFAVNNLHKPAPIAHSNVSGMPKPSPLLPEVGGGPKLSLARGIQVPGKKSAPRRGRGVMNQASASRIPICSKCHRQIRGPFVSALGKTWCPDHFICATETCRKPIIEMGFVEEQSRLYCENCYESYLAPICGKCDKRVKGDCLNAVGKQFHPECFCCAYCGKIFGSGAFYLEDGLPYCETDWNDLFTTKCVGCNFPIEAGDRWVEALNSNYHSQCFKCSKCQKNLEGQSFFAKGGKPFCKAHAQRGF